MSVELRRAPFGTLKDGRAVEIFSFTHANGLMLAVTNFGCVIQSLITPDRHGHLADIVLGFDTLAEYQADVRSFGCVVGRYANRIAEGRFSIGDVDYQLEINSPRGFHIHGGSEGFCKQLWQASVGQQGNVPVLELRHSSPDGHAGYPGNLECLVTYKVTSAGEIEISYQANTDQPTVVNLTNHSYFNLRGHAHATGNGVLDHQAMINSHYFLAADESQIPLPEPVSVVDTALDFRVVHSLGERINNPDPYLASGNGYDHNWIIDRQDSGLVLAATIAEPESGRTLSVSTTQPGIQVYTANAIDSVYGKGGALYQRRGSICLETQHYPDSPNKSHFPSTLITPEAPYHEVAVFKPGVH